MAKAELAAAELVKRSEQKKYLREAVLSLAAIAKVDSEFKHEALLLRREQIERLGGGENTLTADESLALGDDAASRKQWDEATASYDKALELATTAKDAERIAAIRQRLCQVCYRVALAAYEAGQMEESLKLAGQIVSEVPALEPLAESTSPIR